MGRGQDEGHGQDTQGQVSGVAVAVVVMMIMMMMMAMVVVVVVRNQDGRVGGGGDDHDDNNDVGAEKDSDKKREHDHDEGGALMCRPLQDGDGRAPTAEPDEVRDSLASLRPRCGLSTAHGATTVSWGREIFLCRGDP
jgi:hypothetical protein